MEGSLGGTPGLPALEPLQEAERYFEELQGQAQGAPDMLPNTVTYAALISGGRPKLLPGLLANTLCLIPPVRAAFHACASPP